MFSIIFIVGTFIMFLVYNRAEDVTGNGHFYQFYSPILGYFVVASICQSHYFKTSPIPDVGNSIRYFVSIGAAVIMFASNMLIFDSVGIGADDWTQGHFLWILFGFYMFGFDDFLYAAHLSKPFKYNAAKAAAWYGVIWILWGLMAIIGVLSNGSDNDHFNFNYFGGHYQWSVILLLMFAVQWKDTIAELPKVWSGFKNVYVLGTFLLMVTLVGGFIIGEVCFQLNSWRFPEISDNANWHHSLYQGTYPLIPIILFGLYTNHLNHIENIWMRVAARTGVIILASFVLYLFFHLILMPTELLYVEANHHVTHRWYQSIDLYWNFTVSIIALTWAWFTARWGFVEAVKQ
jgi:hypothetical protein